jgi:hypothetical protein
MIHGVLLIYLQASKTKVGVPIAAIILVGELLLGVVSKGDPSGVASLNDARKFVPF